MVDDDGEEYVQATLLPRSKKGYGCLVCGRFLEAEEVEGHWVVVHDNVPHPEWMTYDEESNPQ